MKKAKSILFNKLHKSGERTQCNLKNFNWEFIFNIKLNTFTLAADFFTLNVPHSLILIQLIYNYKGRHCFDSRTGMLTPRNYQDLLKFPASTAQSERLFSNRKLIHSSEN